VRDEPDAQDPHNFEAEKSVLGAILHDPDALPSVVSILSEEDFFADGHRRIFGGMIDLAKQAPRFDVVMLKDALGPNGNLVRAGGAAYLASLMDAVPDVTNVEYYARIVKEKSTLRRLAEAGQRLIRAALSGEEGAGESARRTLEEILRDASGTAAVSKAPWRSLVQVVASMPPPGERIPTGLKALDRCLRGGLAAGRIYIFVAAPFRGKTALVSEIGRHSAQRGLHVAAIYADEGDWQATLMILEGLGFDRADLEDHFDQVSERVSIQTENLDVRIFTPDAVLEDVVEQLDSEGLGNDQLVLILDSVQRVRTRAGGEAQSPKDRADAFMHAVRGIADAHRRWIVLATSKANRASWAKKDPTERIDPLAAGLDSSSIEYDSDFMVFLDGDIEAGITAHVIKNRPGDGSLPSIRLGFNRARATFSEIDEVVAAAETEEQERIRAEAKWSADEGRVLEGLRRYPHSSQRKLSALIHIRPDTLSAVLGELERKGKAFVAEKKGKTPFWEAKSASRDEDES
jgi:replicative DNA helicase